MKTQFWYLFLIFLALVSCAKDPTELGLNLQPQDDLLNVQFTDTTTVIAYSVAEDSMRSDEPSVAFVGELNDPVFGKTSASFYAQMKLAINEFDFGDNPLLDSAVLTLSYTGSIYGDTITQHTFKVYELLDDLHYDSAYYSNQTKQISSNPIGQLTFVPRPNDSIMIDTLKYKAHLRIPLTSEIGMKFINATETDLKDNTEFVKFFKGIYVKAETVNSGGSLVYFSLSDAYTRLLVYYHDDTSTTQKIFRIVIPESSARYNHYDHHGFQGASSDFLNQVGNGDTLLGQERLYIQGLSGVKIRLKFPYIKKWVENEKIAINLAKLVIINNDTSDLLDPPARLSLVGVKDGGDTYLVVPDQLDGNDYFGGTENKGEYNFRVTQYLQSVMAGTFEDEGLALLGYLSTQDPRRIVINGYHPASPATFSKRFKLALTYTKLP